MFTKSLHIVINNPLINLKLISFLLQSRIPALKSTLFALDFCPLTPVILTGARHLAAQIAFYMLIPRRHRTTESAFTPELSSRSLLRLSLNFPSLELSSWASPPPPLEVVAPHVSSPKDQQPSSSLPKVFTPRLQSLGTTFSSAPIVPNS